MVPKLSQADVQVLVDLQLPRTDDIIRPLFFPSSSDYVNKILKGILAVDPKYFGECSMPRLAERITWKRETFNTRRPGFLVCLSDTQYVAAFHKVMDIQHPIPKWGEFIRLTAEVSEPMKKILQHVLYWYQPSWKYPERASNQMKTFNWVKTISTLLFTTNPSGEAITQEAGFEQALALVQALWNYVEANKDKFAIKALEDYVGIFQLQLE
jgi:hypothetical protein